MSKERAVKERLKKKILKVIKGSKLASLATIADNRPWVRYVVTRNNGLRLYVCTFKNSRKMAQISQNPNVHITIGGSLENMDAPYVQIAAKAKIRADLGIRRKLWHKFMRRYYSGINDPDYAVIEIIPRLIEYRDSETKAAQVYI